ncbi:MAG: hypothetical protein ACTSRA_16635 [Promethearchaeota archaeon]
MAKHFGDKMMKYYIEYCPHCKGHNTGEIINDTMRNIKLFKCKRCGFYYALDHIKDRNPKYYNLDKTQLGGGK